MKIKTEAYDIFGQLIPEQNYEAVSSFACSMPENDDDPPFPEPVVCGLWVKTGGTTALPIYLTQEQTDKLIKADKNK